MVAHHVRCIAAPPGRRAPHDSWWRRAAREAFAAFAYAFAIFCICIGWFIGISRLWVSGVL